VPYEPFRASDDQFFVVGVGTDALWKCLVKMLGMETDLGRDARFQTNALRIQNRETLIPLLQKIFQQHPAASWLQKLAQAEIPAAPINTVSSALDASQTRARNLIVQLEHPAVGTAKSIANPIRLSNTPVTYRLPPPLLGEHTSQILHTLGYSPEDIHAMSAESAT
jgi:crotonobetainyl-CoA:carnitine CoA-transferase CaiB-like acyl-CoA transferase